MRSHGVLLTALVPLVLLIATEAMASRPSRRARSSARRPPSVSIGYANSGRLQNGVPLTEDETIRYLPGRSLHYGTEELVGLIRRAAARVFRRHRVRLTVGDLSARTGGPVGHHASHQSGRDVDLAFYVTDTHGRTVYLNDYVGFDAHGRAMAGGPLRFDTARNWDLVEALIDDPSVRVQHIFVSHGLRALLLAYARRHGVSDAIIARAEAVMHQPVGASSHANHFHVRIGCPSDDTGCMDGIRPRPRPQHIRSRALRRHPRRAER